ncbi:WW domain-containing protein [Aphelenchoides fujianensis]|nr:WW domain-containing protein [Aphelenchoides fujianensis]
MRGESKPNGNPRSNWRLSGRPLRQACARAPIETNPQPSVGAKWRTLEIFAKPLAAARPDDATVKEKPADLMASKARPSSSSAERVKQVGNWSEQISSSGKRYFYNHQTEVSQWDKPAEWRAFEKKLSEQRASRPPQPTFLSAHSVPAPAKNNGTSSSTSVFPTPQPAPSATTNANSKPAPSTSGANAVPLPLLVVHSAAGRRRAERFGPQLFEHSNAERPLRRHFRPGSRPPTPERPLVLVDPPRSPECPRKLVQPPVHLFAPPVVQKPPSLRPKRAGVVVVEAAERRVGAGEQPELPQAHSSSSHSNHTNRDEKHCSSGHSGSSSRPSASTAAPPVPTTTSSSTVVLPPKKEPTTPAPSAVPRAAASAAAAGWSWTSRWKWPPSRARRPSVPELPPAEREITIPVPLPPVVTFDEAAFGRFYNSKMAAVRKQLPTDAAVNELRRAQLKQLKQMRDLMECESNIESIRALILSAHNGRMLLETKANFLRDPKQPALANGGPPAAHQPPAVDSLPPFVRPPPGFPLGTATNHSLLLDGFDATAAKRPRLEPNGQAALQLGSNHSAPTSSFHTGEREVLSSSGFS